MNPYHAFLTGIAPFFDGFTDKVVMDVGCEKKGDLIRCLTEDFGARIAIGLNPMWPNTVVTPRCQIVSGDIRQTNFEDNTFDVIVSNCAFEHIPNLDLALVEMHRILKPGGYVLSHHGPLWSTCYGHHLHLPGGTYWNIVLPPWCHLLMLEQELAAWLSGKYPPQLIQQILDWVYRDSGQNRLMYGDHVRIYKDSPLDLCFCHGYTYPELSDRYRGMMTGEVIQNLKSRYPNEEGFFYEGIDVLMRKRG